MKEIVIISGKGGTGKSSICAALADYLQKEIVLADCDVDAADLHLIFDPHNSQSEDFYSGVLPVIHPEKCSNCGICASICRFDAIHVVDGQHQVVELNCEGCGYCFHVCPESAITLIDQNIGEHMISETRFECDLVHARLDIGADNSGKLVAKVKSIAKDLCKKQNKDYLIVDGSPGIGCPVIASLAGADYVIYVTEASLSGLSDLKRVWELVDKFQIPGSCIVNKVDINPEVAAEIHRFLDSKKILHLADIPYSEDFPKAISMGYTILEQNKDRWQPVIEKTWQTIREKL